MPPRRAAFTIADQTINPGQRGRVDLPIAALVSGTPISLSVLVLHGRNDGPVLTMTAALHGDEVCGVEIIRRVLSGLDPRTLSGTVLAVPIVNVHGFNTGDRYLPDRRDLNRLFPGSARGSIGSRIANLLMTEVVRRSDIIVDLHTGSDHRTNLPQIRGNLDDSYTLELAQVFGAPVALHAEVRDGSLRQAATEAEATALLFEAGEADRFDRDAIAVGVQGVRRILGSVGMTSDAPSAPGTVQICRSSSWARATRSGMLHLDVELGSVVEAKQTVATIFDPFGSRLGQVISRLGGVVVGHTQRPLVNRGDAIVHIAR